MPTIALETKSSVAVATVAEALAELEPADLDGFLEEARGYVGRRGQELAKLWEYVDEEIPDESKQTEPWSLFDSIFTSVISDPEKWTAMLARLEELRQSPSKK